MKTNFPMVEWWYAALAAEVGIALVVSNPTSAAQQLYAARKAAADVDLAKIKICQSPIAGDQLWLIKEIADAPPQS